MAEYRKDLKLPSNKTTPANVAEALKNLFNAKWNVPTASKHCGMTEKEMKMTFWEYVKTHPITYVYEEHTQLHLL